MGTKHISIYINLNQLLALAASLYIADRWFQLEELKAGKEPQTIGERTKETIDRYLSLFRKKKTRYYGV